MRKIRVYIRLLRFSGRKQFRKRKNSIEEGM